MFPKPKRWKNKAYRDAARGQDCKLRLPCCNYNTETTVPAHNGGAGWAMKSDDHDLVDACMCCHGAIDGAWPYPDIDKREIFQQARIETIQNRIDRGKVKPTDMEFIGGILEQLLNEFGM